MSNFNETKRQQLEANKAQKQKEYEDTAEALRVTLNPGDKSKLQRALDGLEAEIRQIEAELAKLDQAPVHSPADSSSIQRPRPFMAEALPPDFVARPMEFEAIIRSLIHADQGTVAITAALKGAGGYGKTTLARAVCHSQQVRAKFTEGVLWVTLGEKVTENDLIAKVLDLVEILLEKRPTVVTLEAAKNELKEAVGEQALLLVVDDVWQAGHALPFLNLGANMAVLITTRNSNTLPPYAVQHDVDAMQPREAVQLLQAGLPAGEIRVLTALAKRLGEWPLLLKLANGQLRAYVGLGASLLEALNTVNTALNDQGFVALDDPDDLESRNRAAAASLAVSLDLLKPDQRAKFERLAIFPEDADVPLVTLEKLWQTLPLVTVQFAKRLIDLSLLVHFDMRTRTIRLHDVVRTYLCELQASDLPAKHAAFLEAYKIDAWHTLPADEPYLWRWLGYHLRAAGQTETLRGLLLDFNFLQAKLNATDANTLIADFEGLTDDEPLRLVESALSMSAHVISEDKTQFGLQLYGRLMGHKEKQYELEDLIKIAQANQGYLRLLHPTLSQAGGAFIRTIRLENVGWDLTPTNDGKHLVVCDGTQVKVFVWRTGTLLTTFSQHTEEVNSVSVQGELAFSASSDKTVKVWHWATGELITTFTQHSDTVNGVIVQGELAFSASSDKTVKVWHWATGELITDFTQHSDTVNSISAQGELAFSASNDHTVKVWRWATGELITNFTQHTASVSSVRVQDELAFSASWDQTVKVWRWATGKLITNFTHFARGMRIQGELAFSSSIAEVKVWRWATGELITNFAHHRQAVVSITIQGELAFSASDDQTVKVWRWATGDLITNFTQHRHSVVSINVQGELVFSASYDKTVKVWRWATGELITDFTQHTRAVNGLSIQGELAFSASDDKTVKVWRWATGELITDFTQHTRAVKAVSVQGELAFSASDDQTVKVWRWATGELITNFTQHTKGVLGVSVQGELAFSASDDQTVKVWRWTTGELLTTFSYHRVAVFQINVQGRLAFTGALDQTLKVWHWATGEVVATFTTDAPLPCTFFEPEHRVLLAGDALGHVHVLRVVGLDHLLFPEGEE